MRYDQGYARGYDHGWQAGHRAALEHHDHELRRRHYRGGRIIPGYDGVYNDEPYDTAFGRRAYGSPNQHPASGETDFLGRPYPAAAMDNQPWGLMDTERSGMARGYDRGYFRDAPLPHGYDAGFRSRPRYAADYGRPEDYHPRFMPDSDVGGVDAHRLRRGPMGHTSDWTRWF